MRTRLLSVLFLLLPVVASAQGATVTTDAQAEAALKKARTLAATLGITVPREILVVLRTRDELMTESNGRGGLAFEKSGFYRAYNPESIWVESGRTENQTVAILAHELTHAWQSTEAPSQDRRLTEGFSRWVEYKVCLLMGENNVAARLVTDASPDYGEGLRYLLTLEKEKGAAAVVEYARTQRDIPAGQW